MKYTVSVEKSMYVTGTVTVSNCESPQQAIDLVEGRIDTGDLQTTDVTWGDPQYEDNTFATTGDVDECVN